MRFFECQSCGHPLYFENFSCESCGRRLGFLPARIMLSSLKPSGDRWRALADPDPAAEYVNCANLKFDGCNWLLPAESDNRFCLACRHNRTVPDLSDERNVTLWRRIETAKRR